MRNFWTYLKTKSFRNNLLLAVGSVVAVVLIAFFSLSYYTRHGSGIPVPKLKGMNVDHATDLLEQQGFRYQVDSVYVLDQAPGTVIEQDPDPGINVKEGRTIYLTVVTKLAPNITMPDLEQATYREAIATLSNYGLKVGDTTYISDIARDRVLEVKFGGQTLRAGAKIPKGSTVDLVLGDGQGASEVDIPELINLDLDAARFAIKGAGLTVGTITYEGTITDSANVVVTAQSPTRSDSLSKASIGTRINLTVSQGKALPNEEIKATELLQKLEAGLPVIIIDVREPIEYHTHNIGGVNIPLGTLQAQLDDLDFDLDDEIVMVCKAGLRSRTAQAILAQNGYTNVYNLTGGLTALQRLKN